MLGACNNDNGEYIDINDNEPLSVTMPSNFPPMVYNVEENPPTKYGFELGKKLFYDGKLSANGFISCGFCHEQRFSFTHHGHQFSHGIDDKEGTRNTPSIANMAFFSEFAWDGATSHLDLFPIIPITNEVENFLKAIAQFMVMMVSYNSKYDKYVRNEDGVTLTEQELQGMHVFQEKCASCHTTDLFSDGSFRNNGLPPNSSLNDIGRAEVSGSTNDNYKFKVPSLRNVTLTAPYMHDGRFGSLESVLNFYQNGVQDSPTLDPLLKTEEGLGISLDDTEKLALIAFLGTLTDEEFINDERFAEY